MRILADTNILARLAQPAHRQHEIALQAVEALLSRDDDPCIVPQLIYEFWVVATKPSSANGLGMSVAEANAEIAKAGNIFTLLRDERAILREWLGLVVAHDEKGKLAHDARLVAAMIRHELPQILTFNASDFARFPGVTAVTPDEVVRSGRSPS